MKTNRLLPIALFAALGILSCDDQTGPDDKGTVSFQLTFEEPPTAFDQTAMPDFPVGVVQSTLPGTGPIHFASSGPGSDSTAQTVLLDSTEALFAQMPSVDQVEVRLVGNGVTETVTMTQQGNEFVGTSTQLAAGNYQVFIRGFEAGEVTFYREDAVTAGGGDQEVSITLNLFVPVLQPFQTPTTFTSFIAVFTPVTDATGYQIEADTTPAFTTPNLIPANTTPAGLFSSLPGTFYVRVRAENANVLASEAQPSNTEMIEFLADTTSGSDQGSAWAVGTGITDSLNILPAGDEDWFSIDLNAGDAVSVGVYTETLTPASTLDPVLTILDAAGDTVDTNDNEDNTTVESYLDMVPILSTGTYFLVVTGKDSSTGYYELEVVTGNAIASVAITPTADTVSVAGDTVRFMATAFDGGGNAFSGINFAWSTGDGAVATVDATGLVTTTGVGTTTVTATAPDGTFATASVAVILPPIDQITLDRDADALAGSGVTVGFTASAFNAGNPVPGITFNWVSLDTNVATVDNTGNVTSVRGGQTSIGASAGGITAYATITVDHAEGTPVTLFADEISGTPNQLEGVFGFSSSNFYTFGDDGVIQYDGTSWSNVLNTSPSGVKAMWGGTPTNVLAVGDGGLVRRFDGTSWNSESPGTSEQLWAMWAASPNDVFVVGASGTILHHDGTNWASHTSGTTELLWGAWGTSASDVYAVGTAGTILHYDGATWSPMTSGTTEDLNGIWGFAPDSIYAVGNNGTVLIYDGVAWNAVATGATGTLTSVWGTGSSDVYATGFGENWYFDGLTWWNISSDSFEAIYGSTNPIIFAAGAGGTLKQAYRGASFLANAALDTLVSFNDTITVVVAVEDSLGNPISGVSVTWSSSDSAVAIPDANGVVTGLAEGTADITALSSSLSDIFSVTVYQTVDAVSLNLDTLFIQVGTQDTLVASPFDANGNAIAGRATAWSTGDPGVATVVVDSGYVDGVMTGQTTVTADVDGVMASTTVLVPLATSSAVTTAVGEQHACGIDASGNAWCWGSNSNGELGDALGAPTSSPVQVTGGLTFMAIGAGRSFTCGVTDTYDIYCWGFNGLGQLGDGSFNNSLSPVKVSSTRRFLDVQLGHEHACGLSVLGAVQCWGRNFEGQLGNAGSGTANTPVNVFGGRVFQAISGGFYHTCGVEVGGDAYCWGWNNDGQLGNGNTGTNSTIPALVSNGLSFTTVTAGDRHTCALEAGTDASFCWGDNNSFQFGNGGSTDANVPTATMGMLAFKQISSFANHNCALTTADAAYCWGRNSFGQLGDGTFSWRSTPTATTMVTTFEHIAAGDEGTCGRVASGDMYCWGNGTFGTVGDGSLIPITPQAVQGGTSFTSVTGGWRHTCGLDLANAAWCWGDGGSGQIGDAAFNDDSLPQAVFGPPNAYLSLEAGGFFTCGIDAADSTGYCWGQGGNGQLGNASTSNTSVPNPLAVANQWLSLDPGYLHACGVDLAGDAYCWGWNNYGQLGDGNLADLSVPTLVLGGGSYTSVASGYGHSCALAADSTAYCWGRGFEGQLGDNSSSSSTSPVAVAGGHQWIDLEAFEYTTCGIRVDSTAMCWGYGFDGALGDGSMTSQPIPVAVSGGLQFNDLNSGMRRHICGTTIADQPYCWGWNPSGQIGDGTAVNVLVPTAVSGGLDAISLAAGGEHSCLVTSSNAAHCWGANDSGQLGLGIGRNYVNTPSLVVGGLVFQAPPPPPPPFVSSRR